MICGTTGEASTMPDPEHKEVIRFAVEKVKSRVPVIAGTGSNDTRHAIELSRFAQEAGADAILTVTPYYNKATQNGLYMHFKAIAESIDIPVILYNVPSRTVLNIDPSTLQKLSEVRNIAGVKECNLSQTGKVAALCGPDFTIYSGEDGQVLPMLAYGGKGVISVAANIVPADMHYLVESFLNGDIEKSRNIQLKLLPLIDALFGSKPDTCKSSHEAYGFNAGKCRLPLTEIEPKNLENLKNEMKKYGLWGEHRMTNILLSGCNGKMGQTIVRLSRGMKDVKMIAGHDIDDSGPNGFPVFKNIFDCSLDFDVIVDFSNPAAFDNLVEFAVKRDKPAVIATTGLSAKQLNRLKEASELIPVFFSANMSLGINILVKLVEKTVRLLKDNFDIEIIEKHHNRKVDAPSGTALLIADSINEVLGGNLKYAYDRHSVRRRRDPNEIGIHRSRGNNHRRTYGNFRRQR